MASTIQVIELHSNSDQKALLEKLFVSPGLSLLKEIIAARCVKAQVNAMNAGLYSGANEKAEATFKEETLKASQYNTALDVLDDLGKKDEEWFTIKLEPRR